MNIRLKPLVYSVLLSTTGLIVTQTCFGATATDKDPAVSAQIKQLQAQTVALQKQLEAVQHQLAAINAEQTTSAKQSNKTAAVNSSTAKKPVKSVNTKTNTQAKGLPPTGTAQKNESEYDNKSHIVTAYEQNVLEPANEAAKGTPFGQHSLAHLGGIAVITSPYLHPNVAYDGGDLIVNYSSIYKDANVLHQRQNFEQAMKALGYVRPKEGTLLELSGEVEGQMWSQRGYGGHNANDINLTDAELDFQALMNPWITAFGNFVYDDSPPESGARTFNSNVIVDNAFLTLGNLNITKWRATIGQVYIPFGSYDSFLLSDPIDKTLFRTKGRPIQIAYGVPGTPGFSGSTYVFRGDTRTGDIIPDPNMNYGVDPDRDRNDHINQWGLDGNYDFDIGKLHADFGASYINNVADADGMQATAYGSDGFEGFGESHGDQVLKHRVPGADVRGQLSISQVSLIGEYTTSLQDFNQGNLTYNDHGAKPSAYHVEGVYSFNVLHNKPATFALGYDHSYEALGLNVPEQRIAATINIAFWRNTLASLELRHDINYDSDDTATGNLSPVIVPDGHTANAITAQFDVYF